MYLKSAIIFLFFLILCQLHINASANDSGEWWFTNKNIDVWLENLQKNLVKSEACDHALKEWFNLLISSAILEDNWAWKMFDSMDKINSGILTGNMVGPGNMDECLAIDEVYNNVNIKGKYCYASFSVPLGGKRRSITKKRVEREISNHTNRVSMIYIPEDYAVSICMPHACSLLELDPTLPVDPCQTKDTLKDWDDGDWAFVVFLIIIAVLVISSSLYDWYIRHNKLKEFHPIAVAFSFYTNTEKLLRINNNPDQLQSLNGIRALSMLWILTGHRFFNSLTVPIMNLHHAKEWAESWHSQYIKGAIIAVDSFFFLTGVLLGYSFMKTQSKPNARFNIILFYVHRYLRLTPAVAVLYFFIVTFAKHATSGPMWPILAGFDKEVCLDNSVAFFLYIQNIINPEAQCLGHTWYLSVDFQIFLISPIILLPMVKYPKYAGYALIGLILLSILPPTLITYFMDIVYYGENFMKHYYSQPYTRISPWLVGVLLGYLFYQLEDRKVKINAVVNLCIWIIVLATMTYITYLGNEMLISENISALSVYNGLHRLFWAIGLMWIVFACQYGYGGIINWFLTLPIFQIMGRLSYSMYLLHVVIQNMAVARKRTPIYFDDYEVLNQAFGDIITVTLISFIYCLLFESPMVVIEKVLFGPSSYIVKGMEAIVIRLRFGAKSKKNLHVQRRTVSEDADVSSVNPNT